MVKRFPFVVLGILQVVLLSLPSRAEPPPSPVLLPGFPMVAGDNVLLFWSPVPYAVSYKVFLDGRLLDATGASTYQGALPVSGDEARYQVSAVSEKGEESQPGPAGILRLRKIESPKGLESSVNPEQPSVVLIWNAVRGSIGYNIFRVADKGAPELLHSGSDCQFRDRTVRKGSRYGYAVAAIDRSGREGDRSPWHAVGVPEEPQPATAAQSRSGTIGASASGALRKGKEKGTGRENAREKTQEKTQEKAQPKKVRTTFLLDAAFHEVMSIDRLKDASLQELSYLGPGIDNNFWVVLPRTREVHAISRSGEIVATLGPAVLDAAAKGFTPHKLAVGADGRLVISDARNGTVACFGRNGDLLWSRRVDPPPGGETQVWEGFPAGYRNLPATPSSVLIVPGEILVADQRFQLIYRLSPEGEPRGYITHYRKGENTWRLRRVGELEEVPGKGILVTFPLARKGLLLDREFRVVSEIAGSRKDPASGLIGLHGVRFAHGEGILLTDPTSGKVKLYDPETGEHLQDLRTPMLPGPNMASWDGRGRLWVYLARENRIAVLGPEGAGR